MWIRLSSNSPRSTCLGLPKCWNIRNTLPHPAPPLPHLVVVVVVAVAVAVAVAVTVAAVAVAVAVAVMVMVVCLCICFKLVTLMPRHTVCGDIVHLGKWVLSFHRFGDGT